VVEQAKTMEGTKSAQWVPLRNCLIYKIINKTSPSDNVRKKLQTRHMTLLSQLKYKPNGVPNVDMRYEEDVIICPHGCVKKEFTQVHTSRMGDGDRHEK
jgi:hypothetical protein